MIYLAAALILMATAYAVRYRLRDHVPVLQRKAGESPAEARLIVLGTYRVYSWALALAIILISANAILGKYAPWWLPVSGAILTVMLLVLARALYWRLGYDTERPLLMLGHLSGTFALSECIFTLRTEVLRVAGTSTADLH